jgi:hypothetical protein
MVISLVPHQHFQHKTNRINFSIIKILDEVKNIKSYLYKNINDNSAYSYLTNIIQTFPSFITMDEIINLFQFNKFLDFYYPGHESIWAFRKSLWTILIQRIDQGSEFDVFKFDVDRDYIDESKKLK